MRAIAHSLRVHRPWFWAIAWALLLSIATGGIGSGATPALAPLELPRTLTDSAVVFVAPAFHPTEDVQSLGAMPAETPLELTVALALSNPQGLAAQIALEYTPGSAEFHRFLSPGTIASRYGPTGAQYTEAQSYFRSEGLSVETSPDQMVLTVAGPSGRVAQAFGTSFEEYRQGTRLFYSHPTPAQLPSNIPWAGVVGLGNATPPIPFAVPTDPIGSASPNPTAAPCADTTQLTPCEADRVYNLTGIVNAGDNGTGVRIGIVDAYDGSEPQPQLESDLATFAKKFSIPVGNVSYVYPVPTMTDLNATSTGWGTEEALDLEWSRGMAPGASIDMTLAPNPTAGLYASVDYLVAHDVTNVITLSWGEPDVGVFDLYSTPCSSGCNASSDGSYTILHPVLEAAAAEGISVFAATGDCGASGGTSGDSTDYPASDPYVTAVGATDLALNASGGYGSETGWSGNSTGAVSPGCTNQGGSGGGYAPLPRPYWQSGPGLGASALGRGIPDVSMVGGSPGAEIVVDGGTVPVGGTSLASPMWAGLAADADTRAGSSLGFLNPSLYAVFRSPSGAEAFHDITQGWNGYNAGPGWDPVTGIGTPNAAALVPLLSSSPVLSPSISVGLIASPRYGSAPLTVTLHANASGGSGSFPWFDLDFGDGNATLSSTGNATHTYPVAGVYVARAVAFDSKSNSSFAQPVAVVVGGGGTLDVRLSATPTHPAVGGLVTFQVNVSGGPGPYVYDYTFGDGTSLGPWNLSTVTHIYGASGGACASVIVSDARNPPDGAESSAVPIAIGKGTAPVCAGPTSLKAELTPSAPALDYPGDFAFRTNASGGVGPYSTILSSDDPYVGACQCGIFSRVGNHTVEAEVADSLDSETNASTNVTVYPALVGAFTANPVAGPAPLNVSFSVALSGGHDPNASRTFWTFGDGTNGSGASVTHRYPNPGWYVAIGLATDAFGGRTSEAFLVDAYALGSTPPTVLTANVTPAVDAPAGTLVTFNADAAGTAGPYRIHWTLGDNGSGFGSSIAQTYPYLACSASGACPTVIGLEVEDDAGTWLNLSIPLAPTERGNATALLLQDSLRATEGTTPFAFSGQALARGMPKPSLLWNFGDGTGATGPWGNHTYLTPGNYTVTETVTDPYGDLLVRPHAVVVLGIQRYAPELAGAPTDSEGLAPFKVHFLVLAAGGAGGPYTYQWTFGDGTDGSGPSIDHTYLLAGLYEANVTAYDRIGDPVSASFPIDVFNLTPVSLALDLSAPTVAPSALLSVSVLESAVCGRESVSNCSAEPGHVEIAILPFDSPDPNASSPLGRPIATGSNGWSNTTLTCPSNPGNYLVFVWVNATGYAGLAEAPLNVTQGPGSRTDGLSLIVDEEVAAVLALLGVLIVVSAIVWLRRRPPGETLEPAPASGA